MDSEGKISDEVRAIESREMSLNPERRSNISPKTFKTLSKLFLPFLIIYSLVLIPGSGFSIFYRETIGFSMLSVEFCVINCVIAVLMLIITGIFVLFSDRVIKNPNRGYDVVLFFIPILYVLSSITALIVTPEIHNFQETYKKCCIDNIDSSKVYYNILKV